MAITEEREPIIPQESYAPLADEIADRIGTNDVRMENLTQLPLITALTLPPTIGNYSYMIEPETGDMLSTAAVARIAGVHRDTLLRWLREGRIVEPARDRNGWRVFTKEQAAEIVAFARSGATEVPSPYGDTTKISTHTLSNIDAIDWDFPDAKTSYLTHGLHPYPAKYIPQIPNALIQELSSVGDIVGDIFCGSGTTLVEALLLKRNAVGVDANPLACLISAAKTTRFGDGDEEALRSLADRASQLAGSVLFFAQPNLFGIQPFKSSAPRPDHKAIAFWFEPFVVEELAEILSWCQALPTLSSRTVALTAFSAIVVSVSRQDGDTRYVRRNKNIAPGEALRRFSRALCDAIRAVAELTELVEPRFTCTVHQSSVLEQPDVGPLDLVVCSPPYPNAYSYHLYHMTRMLWLGMDQPGFKREEIGSHRKYSNKGANAATIETFRTEMALVFEWLHTHVRPAKFACFVIGDSTVRGERISNVDLLTDVAREHGFSEMKRIHRQMQSSKKTFNPAIGKIKDEQILVLRNGRGSL